MCVFLEKADQRALQKMKHPNPHALRQSIT
jgi:hypothetical protein